VKKAVLRFAVFAVVVLAAIPAATARAAQQMPVGFFDDISFRFSPDHSANLASAAATGASVIHTTANWAAIAPTKPADPSNPNDPAYRLADLNDLVASASRYGFRVMIDVTGSPKWANGGHTPNYMPKNVSAFGTFVRMLATLYSGRNAGKGSVALWSIWNEPNLQQFLYPQFNGKTIVSVSNYAKLLKAGYAAIKAANPNALVAAGETSAQGRDKPLKGASETVAPGTFARLLAKQPGVKFDAWAHHPYPTSPGAKPLEQVRYPNVTLSQLPRFEKDLRTWFHRAVPVWITEYGHETKPGEPKGVTPATQAAYAKQALTVARRDPNIQMFIWFTFRDSSGNPWQSGLENPSGTHKPSYSAFSSLARSIDGTTQTVKAGKAPTVKVYVPLLSYFDAPGTTLGMTYRVFDGSTAVGVGQPTSPLGFDQSVSFIAQFKPVKGHTYKVTVAVNDPNGQTQTRTATLVAS
jgi:Cellulase (glycosyl hydrolase family 5)